MTKLQETSSTHHGINFHLLQTKKYKTITLVAKLKAKLTKETATKRALLSYVLEKGTKNYASEKTLQMKLDELYGATLGIYCNKMGENHIITFRMEIANEKYIKQATGILEEAIELFAEIITQPKTEGESFPKETIQREKTTLTNKLNSIYDDKMAYANMRLLDEMYKNEAYATHTYGYVEDIEAITGEDLYRYYMEDVLQYNDMDLYVIGDIDPATTEKALQSAFTIESQASPSEKGRRDQVPERRKEDVQVVKDKQPIQQAKLHIGYQTNTRYTDEEHAALRIFNNIFGGTPSSKLFVNVREKNSLAYYVGSRLEVHQGLMIVLSGIEPNKETAAREIIEEQLQAMQAGDFTEEAVTESKAYMISQIKETLDSAVGTIELLYQNVVGGKKLTPEAYIEAIEQVTKDAIVQVANKIQQDTIYVLTSEEEADHA